MPLVGTLWSGTTTGEQASIWSFNYFFYNRKMKRILYFSCRAISKAAADEVGRRGRRQGTNPYLGSMFGEVGSPCTRWWGEWAGAQPCVCACAGRVAYPASAGARLGRRVVAGRSLALARRCHPCAGRGAGGA